MKKLCDDSDFYLYCGSNARKSYVKHFHESVYLSTWHMIVEDIF